MYGSIAEAGNAPIQEMVGVSRSGYPRDKSRACSSGEGGGGGEESEGEGEYDREVWREGD